MRLLARALDRAVRDGAVDYEALRRDRALDDYLAAIAGELPRFATTDERKGFFIDAYNACVLHVVATRPSLRSIQELGEPFKQPLCRVGGRTRSLDDIEDHELRATGDARVHMALVCASRGCPSLERMPWQGPRLEARLDEAARRFLAEAAHARVDDATRTLFVSQLFQPDWLGGDFARQAGTVEAWLRRYGPPSLVRALDEGYRLAFIPWDWSLNAAKAR